MTSYAALTIHSLHRPRPKECGKKKLSDNIPTTASTEHTVTPWHSRELLSETAKEAAADTKDSSGNSPENGDSSKEPPGQNSPSGPTSKTSEAAAVDDAEPKSSHNTTRSSTTTTKPSTTPTLRHPRHKVHPDDPTKTCLDAGELSIDR